MGVFRRGQVWYFRFRFRGRSIKRAVGPTMRLAQDAERAERRQVAEAWAAGRWGLPRAAPAAPTLRDYVGQVFLPQHLPQVAPSSQRQLRSLAGKLVRALGQYRLDELGPAVLDPWAARRMDGQGGVSAAQVVNDARALAQILNHARRQGVLADRPMRGWRWPMPRPPAFHIVSAPEERRLLRAAPAWFRSWIRLALATGLRKGELRLLERRHALWARAELRLLQPKVHRAKVIPLAPATVALLRGLQRPGTPYLLASPDGRPLTVNRINRVWDRTRRRAGLPHVRFQDLRHTFATRALEVPGSSVPVVGEMLGHKPPLYKMTWRYVHALPEAKRAVIAGLAGPRRRTRRGRATRETA